MSNQDVRADTMRYTPQIDDLGELPLTARRDLLASLRNRLPSERSVVAFEAVLGLACARRVWPVWQSAFPAVADPMDLAVDAVAMATNEGRENEQDERAIDRLKTYLDGKFLLGEQYFPAIYAGFACWAVARDVITGGVAPATSGDSESDIPPEEWDSCFLASLAATGGATWEGISDPSVRRGYWYWYLDIAVPEAFGLALAATGA